MDNMYKLALSQNPVFHEQSNHINRRLVGTISSANAWRMEAFLLSLSAQKANSQTLKVRNKDVVQICFHELRARIGKGQHQSQT